MAEGSRSLSSSRPRVFLLVSNRKKKKKKSDDILLFDSREIKKRRTRTTAKKKNNNKEKSKETSDSTRQDVELAFFSLKKKKTPRLNEREKVRERKANLANRDEKENE